MEWDNVFGISYQKQPYLTETELEQFMQSWHKPLTAPEIDEIISRQRNPFPVAHPLHAQYAPFDPGLWSIPHKALPASYLDFLRYSNGGEFVNGERYFQFFSAAELRPMLLAYEFPEYMPGAVPFAMDGSGNHYIWDMRMERDAPISDSCIPFRQPRLRGFHCYCAIIPGVMPRNYFSGR